MGKKGARAEGWKRREGGYGRERIENSKRTGRYEKFTKVNEKYEKYDKSPQKLGLSQLGQTRRAERSDGNKRGPSSQWPPPF